MLLVGNEWVQILLRFAPIITPVCGMLGAIVALMPLRNPHYDLSLVLSIAGAATLILGVPPGILFWAMSKGNDQPKRLWMGVMSVYCVCLFVMFYWPVHGFMSL